MPGDYDLQYFDTQVTHDTVQIIPFIRAALDTAKAPIRLLASPWSPPSWLKATDATHNASMLSSVVPNGLIDTDEAKTTWAKYISKFITAYDYLGIKIWAVTPQNEPEFPVCSTYYRRFISFYKTNMLILHTMYVYINIYTYVQAPWEACAYTSANEKDFVSGYLGPALRQEHPEVLILGFDHNKDHLNEWSEELLQGKGHHFVDGMAFHW